MQAPKGTAGTWAMRAARRVLGSLPGAAAVAAAAALLGMAAVSAPFFTSAAGTALLERELSAGGAPALFEARVSGTAGGPHLRGSEEALAEALAEHGLAPPEMTVVVWNAAVEFLEDTLPDGQEVWAGQTTVHLVGLPAFGTHLPPVVEPGDGQFAVTEYSAGRLPPLDDLDYRLVGGRAARRVTIAPVVEDLRHGEIPPPWQPVGGLLRARDDDEPSEAPALLADTDTVISVMGIIGTGDRRLPVRVFQTTTFRVPVPDGDALTLERARELLPAAADVERQAADPLTALGRTLGQASRSETGGSLGRGSPQLRLAFGPAVERVEAAVAEMRGTVTALAVAGQLLALATMVAAGTLGDRGDRRRARLYATRGVSPARVGVRAAARGVVPVAVGVVTGWWLGALLIERSGPGAVDPGVRAGAVLDAGVAGVAGLLVLGISAAALAAAVGRPPIRASAPIAEATAVLLAGVAWWQLRRGDPMTRLAADGGAAHDPLLIALPLLVIVAAAGFGARLLRAVLRRATGAGRIRSPGWYLGLRRLAALRGPTALMVALAAASAGIVVMTAIVAESSRVTGEDKSGVLLGADAVVALPRTAVARERIELGAVRGATTVVRRAEGGVLGGRVAVDVMAIDPSTFGDVAYRPARLAGVDLDGVLAALTHGGDGDRVRAVIVGIDAAPATSLAVEGLTWELAPAARVDAFPGAGSPRPVVVVDAARIEGPEDEASRHRADVLRPYLWVSGGTDAEILADVEVAGLGTEQALLLSEERDRTALSRLQWPLAFLQGQAAALGTVSLLALLASFAVAERRRALSDALAARMGLRPRSRLAAGALELSCTVLAALLVGAAAGTFSALAVLGEYDPLPEVPLQPVMALPVEALSGALAPLAAAVAVTAALTGWAAQRTSVAELLRRG